MKVGYGKNQVGNSGRVSDSLHFQIALNGLYDHSPVQIPGFYSELVIGKFPKVKAQAYDYRKLGMNTWEISGNDSIKGPDNGQFSGILLGKITKCKKFYFHGIYSIQ